MVGCACQLADVEKKVGNQSPCRRTPRLPSIGEGRSGGNTVTSNVIYFIKNTMARPNKSKLKRSWQDVAKEAQDFRDASLVQVLGIAAVFEQDAFLNEPPKNVMTIPCLVLSPGDIQITESLPEELVKLLANGQLSAMDVTVAFLRRAAVAQRLVSVPSAL